MFTPPQPEPVLKTSVEVAKNICEIVAILVGAFWTYLNYFRGRTYRPRLECAIDASVQEHSDYAYLKVVTRVKNVGLSKVPIDQEGTGLLVYSLRALDSGPSSPIQAKWNDSGGAFSVLTNHRWIEPGEPVSEPLMIALSDRTATAYKVMIKVISGKVSWTAETICEANMAYGRDIRNEDLVEKQNKRDQKEVDEVEKLKEQQRLREQQQSEQRRTDDRK